MSDRALENLHKIVKEKAEQDKNVLKEILKERGLAFDESTLKYYLDLVYDFNKRRETVRTLHRKVRK